MKYYLVKISGIDEVREVPESDLIFFKAFGIEYTIC